MIIQELNIFGVDKDEYPFDSRKESRHFGARRTGAEGENHLGASC